MYGVPFTYAGQLSLPTIAPVVLLICTAETWMALNGGWWPDPGAVGDRSPPPLAPEGTGPAHGNTFSVVRLCSMNPWKDSSCWSTRW